MLEVRWQLLLLLQANFRLEDGNGSIHVLLIVSSKICVQSYVVNFNLGVGC